MASADSVVEVDGRRFAVRRAGTGAAIEVEASTGERVVLRPWRLDEHLAALERHVDASTGAVRLDAEGFAADVLAASGVPGSLSAELMPLALWWAAGGGDRSGAPAQGEWFEAGGTRVRLRPWTWAERSRASSECVVTSPGGRALRLDKYLAAMIEASVAETDPPGREAGSLEGAAALVDAVVALNTAGERDEDRRTAAGDEAGRVFAQATLRVCRALGWTPSQVWAAPAAEIDRLMALLDVVEAPGAPAAVSGSRLAQHPDAVVIRVEDG